MARKHVLAVLGATLALGAAVFATTAASQQTRTLADDPNNANLTYWYWGEPDAPGANAYPLINYDYAVVSKKQPSPETAAALRSFLLWAIAPDETNAQYLADAHFVPLPAHVWVLSHDQIEEIK